MSRDEIEARLNAAGPAEKWRLEHRCVGHDKPPAPGIDESAGLGWDWVDGPAEPMRGVFALGADAAFVHHAYADLRYLLDALTAAEAENKRLREALDYAARSDLGGVRDGRTFRNIAEHMQTAARAALAQEGSR